MGIEALLSLVESYIALKTEPVLKHAPRQSDWDCGLASEFESSYADYDRRERLAKLRASLEKALDDYIDQRIQAALANNAGGAVRSTPVS